MAAQLIALSLLSFLLLIGIIISIIATKIKISDILLLIIAGLLLGVTNLFVFDSDFLTALSVFALIMIVFDSTSKFKLREVSRYSPPALKLTLIFLGFSVIFLTLVTYVLFFRPLFDIKFLIVAGVFGALMCGTSPDVILSILKDKKQKIAEILEFESILNTPLTVLIPFIILDLYFGTIQANILVIKFLQGIMTGVGTGLLVGIIIFTFMKKKYLEMISPLVVIAAALVTYTLAENIGGNGVLAVTALGLVFGNMLLKEKEALQKFSSIFTNFLRIVVFIILGLLIRIPLDLTFFIKSLILFGFYIFIRYLATSVTFRKTDVTRKEKIFMSLNVSKGLAVAVVILLFSSYTIEGLQTIIDLSLLFILYSIILSTVSTKYINYFLTYRKNVLKKEIKKRNG